MLSFSGGSGIYSGQWTASRHINAPLNWDIERFSRQNLIPGLAAKKTLEIPSAENISVDGDFGSGAWRNVPWNTMEPDSPENGMRSRFKILCDKDALYIGFECALPGNHTVKYVPVGRDGSAWEQECLEILIDAEGNRERYFHFIFNPVADSYYEAARGYIEDPLHPLYNKPDVTWNGACNTLISLTGRMDCGEPLPEFLSLLSV